MAALLKLKEEPYDNYPETLDTNRLDWRQPDKRAKSSLINPACISEHADMGDINLLRVKGDCLFPVQKMHQITRIQC